MAEGRRPWLRLCVLALLPITAAYVGLIGVEMARQVQEWPLLVLTKKLDCGIIKLCCR